MAFQAVPCRVGTCGWSRRLLYKAQQPQLWFRRAVSSPIAASRRVRRVHAAPASFFERPTLAVRVLPNSKRKRSGDSATEPTHPGRERTCYVLHGLLGGKANWSSFIRQQLIKGLSLNEGWRFVLVDLRNHGESWGFDGPHTMHSAAQDVLSLFDTHGTPHVMLGHSLGGKIALEAARAWGSSGAASGQHVDSGHSGMRVVVLDAVPGCWDALGSDTDRDSVGRLLKLIQSVKPPIPSRLWIRETAREAGFSSAVSTWLSGAVKRMEAGQLSTRADGGRPGKRGEGRVAHENLTWTFDPSTAMDLLQSYATTDSWDVLFDPVAACHGAPVAVDLVVAERSSRWVVDGVSERLEELKQAGSGSGSDGGDAPLPTSLSAPARVHHLPRSGHWVHVDNPQGLAQLITHAFHT